ncbi:hypothetical protein N9Y17_02835 [Gammaproteobacteria bacterium]|nr:hypothetical protein [Gammaproteobacteria bacterium]
MASPNPATLQDVEDNLADLQQKLSQLVKQARQTKIESKRLNQSHQHKQQKNQLALAQLDRLIQQIEANEAS